MEWQGLETREKWLGVIYAGDFKTARIMSNILNIIDSEGDYLSCKKNE